MGTNARIPFKVDSAETIHTPLQQSLNALQRSNLIVVEPQIFQPAWQKHVLSSHNMDWTAYSTAYLRTSSFAVLKHLPLTEKEYVNFFEEN